MGDKARQKNPGDKNLRSKDPKFTSEQVTLQSNIFVTGSSSGYTVSTSL